ncbi:MAG: N-acetylneuraminate synthase family protein [Candidatus Nealsonbacteria bacterium]
MTQYNIKKDGFNFENLFVFDMANNHQGQVNHGLRIIREIAEVVKGTGVRGAMKLQFRELDTFIHPDYRETKDNKHVPRFLGTRLKEEEFAELVRETKNQGMISVVTPFDEPSVDMALRLGVEVLKVASCSAQDWPLLEKIAETGKPIICSTGGLTISQIDKVVSFFQHRGAYFALMYCVGVYPTLNNQLNLNQIEIMKNRYPGVTVGFSTHEEPTNLNAVKVAYSKGARILEKHVGVPTDEIKLNAYSVTPQQLKAWILSCNEAVESLGPYEERTISEQELSDIRSLMRGVFVKKPVRRGDVILKSNVFFAIPIQEGQLSSGQFYDGMVADKDYGANQPLSASLYPVAPMPREIIYSTIHAVKGMLAVAKIPLSHDINVELSHHFGIDNFNKVGCTIIDCFNKEYAKKLIVQTAGQWNPVHYHKKKDETFQVLDGVLEIEVEGKKKQLYPGDTFWMPRGVWHGFGTETGVVFEEISTSSYGDDSFYIDKVISRMPRETRKTKLLNWGRHQFDDFKEENN